MSIYTAYAGLGNPDTPPDIVQMMTRLAKKFTELGYTARTNSGCDAATAFEQNSAQVEVYIPWKKFNEKETTFNKVTPEAIEAVKPYHPTFDSMKPAVQSIMACNAHVILGKDLRSPVKFLVCWTPDGFEGIGKPGIKSGYGGIPIAIAVAQKIPVFNLKNVDALPRLKNFLDI